MELKVIINKVSVRTLFRNQASGNNNRRYNLSEFKGENGKKPTCQGAVPQLALGQASMDVAVNYLIIRST